MKIAIRKAPMVQIDSSLVTLSLVEFRLVASALRAFFLRLEHAGENCRGELGLVDDGASIRKSNKQQFKDLSDTYLKALAALLQVPITLSFIEGGPLVHADNIANMGTFEVWLGSDVDTLHNTIYHGVFGDVRNHVMFRSAVPIAKKGLSATNYFHSRLCCNEWFSGVELLNNPLSFPARLAQKYKPALLPYLKLQPVN